VRSLSAVAIAREWPLMVLNPESLFYSYARGELSR
jgi:hypothetical protein